MAYTTISTNSLKFHILYLFIVFTLCIIYKFLVFWDHFASLFCLQFWSSNHFPPLADKESTKMTNSEQGRSFQDVDKGKQTVTTVNRSQSPDGSKPSNKDDNRADDRYGNYNAEDASSEQQQWWIQTCQV